MKISNFLDLIGSKLREDRPDIPNTHNYTIKQYGNIIHFWFRTQGCKYTRDGYGGCLMCDYGGSSQSSVSELILYVEKGLDEIEKMPELLLVNSSGSFFDDNEVPRDVRISIYKKLSQYQDLGIILETLLETISENKLNEIRDILKTQTIDIEFGLESMNSLYLKYAINKKKINLNNLDFKINLINRYKMNSVANVLIGIPFLSEKEIIKSSVETIHKVFNLGISYVVIFPINIKPYTTVYWLYENNLYENISLWSYIEVLNQVDSKYLLKIELSWYQNKKPNNPLSKEKFRTPTTCEECSSQVVSLLNKFTYNSQEREKILENINAIDCQCKNKWKEKLEENSNFKKNIERAYERMAIDLLGENFWFENSISILKEIENDFTKPILHNKIADIYDRWIKGDYTSDNFLQFYLKLTSELDKDIEIVELGIGTGRISIEIAKNQNRKIIGIDHSSKMLEECRKNIINTKMEQYIQLIEMDIRTLKLRQKAKFIMLPFRTIGHFLSLDDKKCLFKQIYNNLEVGGTFVVDHYIFDREWADNHNDIYIKMYSDGDITIYDKYKFNFDKQVLHCTIYEEIGTIKMQKASFNYSWIEPSQMKKILTNVGFKIKHSYGDFDFSPIDSNSGQQIWIVEK